MGRSTAEIPNAGDDMKKRFPRLALLGGCLCLLLLAAIRFSTPRPFEEISLEKLEWLLRQREDSIILCTQDLCPGCADAERSLKEVSGKATSRIYTFNIDTQSAKELLYQYGLLQVPAVIIIANDQVNVYKGALSKENIARAITTESVLYDRLEQISNIGYTQFLDKVNSAIDFFIFFGSESCADCKTFHEVLEQYIQRRSDAGIYPDSPMWKPENGAVQEMIAVDPSIAGEELLQKTKAPPPQDILILTAPPLAGTPGAPPHTHTGGGSVCRPR